MGELGGAILGYTRVVNKGVGLGQGGSREKGQEEEEEEKEARYD